MGTEYKLRIRSPMAWTALAASPLTPVAEVTDFTSLGYLKAVNSPGQLKLTLPESHLAAQHLVNLAPIEVWRRNKDQNLDWYRDFMGIIRDEEREYKDIQNVHVTAMGIM